MPKKDISLGLFFRQRLPKNDYEAVKFLSDHRFERCQSHYVARLSKEEQQELQEKQQRLDPYIQRLNRRPLGLSSKQLQEAGIAPGPTMGKLLIEAERLSVEKKLQNPDELLAELQRSIHWPSSSS